jgi:hypothetical protein
MPSSIGWKATTDPNGGQVTRTDQDDATVERFAPNGGTATAVIGALVVAACLVAWLFDRGKVPLWVPAVALLAAAILWSSTVRPRVMVADRQLVLRNMLTTVRIPLAAVEEVAVRQVMAVRAGGKRYVCAGAGRSLRAAMKGSSVQHAREQMGGFRGEMAKAANREPGMAYADFVELRVRELANEDLMRRGIRRYSAEADELATHVRREWAWPELVALVAAAAFFAVAVLVR